MLDTDTKRRINTCRDILVGKVPDPKSQVEQITIALIYKFMDDMDLEAEEMGFDRKFFTGEYERYRWAKLLAPGVGGQEMLNTYTEALTKMVENPGIPELFRSIFRNAYLPYRDPETLRGFLREINGFTYDHSERLGDAFEYLLSVLGSQGDAGQFRTPRHIIDFMVEIIAPKKDEVILDPACGTAGFLISSYKHILKSNSTDANGGNEKGADVDASEATIDSPLRYSGNLLTPDERKRLADNIKGYDISPDMVRLSLVNLYLHGFLDPKIDEYDSLVSEDKWGETADVILANPPFMSPKGGIPVHRRFAIQSKRSEVLFVDYIAEHLTPNGRAAIVVPEGIIFQSQSAYRDLRRMLVEANYLVAIVSLPAGVFNPYSGVKTSILILDRAVARTSDSIAFFKIDNDGYGLGAQRRAVKGSQLPQVKAELGAWLEAVRGAGDIALGSSLGFSVAKARIAEGGEYNLSGERYRESGPVQSEFQLVALSDASLFKVESGGTPKSDVPEYWDGSIKWATLVDLPQDDFISQITDTKRTISNVGLANSSAKVIPENSVIVSTRATIGRIGINRVPIATNQGFKNVVIVDHDRASPEYVALALTRLVPTMKALATGGTFAEISKSKFCELKIPLPPLDVQRAIVAEIEGYRKVIDGARSVLKNYRPHVPNDPGWPIAELGEICSFASGGTPSKANEAYWLGQIPWVSAKDLKVEKIFDAALHVSETAVAETATQIVPQGALLVLVRGMGLANGVPICEVMVPCAFNQDLKAILPDKEKVMPRYLAISLRQQQAYFQRVMETAAHGTLKLNSEALRKASVFLPPLETQAAIIAEIEGEQSLVDANRELIARFEKKIHAAIARVWGSAEETAAI